MQNRRTPSGLAGSRLRTKREFFLIKMIAVGLVLLGAAVGMLLIFVFDRQILGTIVVSFACSGVPLGDIFLSYGKYCEEWRRDNEAS